MKTIALVGNPNSGKTTLFNALTGQRQFVGNWPGVTVQVKQGKLRGQLNTLLLDLPGIYSLTPLAPEEAVACDALVNHPPDIVLNIVDGTNLQRNLYLTMQLLELGLTVIVAVNCADVLRKRGDVFLAAMLARELGCPVVEISALRGDGVDRLAQVLCRGCAPAQPASKMKIRGRAGARPLQVAETYCRIEEITRRCFRPGSRVSMTERMDNLVLHRWLALLLFMLVMTGVYYLAAAGPGTWLGGWIESAITVLGQAMPDTWLGVLVREGVLGGAGMLLGFVPQLMMVFLCLSVLEASGYLSRVAFLLDAILRKFGLSGKCFMPMLLATGCSVPAILATRAIDCPRERRITAATCSFLPCSAKLPIIALMANSVLGGAWWLAPLMYFVGAAVMLGSAWLLKRCGRPRTAAPASDFLLEMPQYRLPSGRDIWRSAWRRTAEFMKKAGSVIVLSGVFVWLLGGVLQPVGDAIAWLFVPLGFGFWQAAVATLTAFVAKENAVATLGVLGAAAMFTPASGMSFLLFNLLSMPCVAAVAALWRELGSARRTVLAVVWQCGVAYLVAGVGYWGLTFLRI